MAASPAVFIPPTKGFEESTFSSKDGTRLFHAALVPPEPRGTVIVVHGYGDHSGRYRHVMEALAKAGFASHALDYRGHGKAQGRRGHCDSFVEFIEDLEVFVARVQAQSPKGPLFLLGHSHGGLMVGRYLETCRVPESLKGVVLSGPFFRLKIDPSRFQLFQARVVGKVLPWLPIKNPLTIDQLTKDKAMLEWCEKDTLRHSVVTPKWFTESAAAQDALFADTSRVTAPLLIVHGAEDPVARPDASRAFFDAVPSSDKQYVSLPGMLHEPFSEVDRDSVIAQVVQWISERAER